MPQHMMDRSGISFSENRNRFGLLLN